MTSDSDDNTKDSQTPAGQPPPRDLLQPRTGRPTGPTSRPASRAAARPAVEQATALPAYGGLAADQDGMLRSPYVLAGLAVAGAILLAVVVVFLFGGGDGGAGSTGGDGVSVTPLTPLPGRGVAARSIATATVREGPSAEYLEIGLLRSGQDVEVVGRNAESTWFQIFYPPQSQLRGWVPASALRIPDTGAGAIAVVAVTPIPRPTIAQPTPEPLPTGTVTPTPTTTGTPGAAGPDLAISVTESNCEAGQLLQVTVRNAGALPVTNRELRITVSTPSGVVGLSNFSITLEPGAATSLPTSQVVQAPRTSARIDLIGTPSDANNANNSVDCVVAGGAPRTPTPTRTPRP